MSPPRPEKTDTRLSPAELLVLTAELALVLVLAHRLDIENPAFRRVLALAAGGFVVHAILPLRFRQLFFAGLSFAAILVVFDPSGAAWLIGLGLGLVGLCHLPGPFSLRVAAVAVAGALLALGRTDWFRLPFSAAVWPILGSMFMFRLVVYLYDIRHEKEPPTVARTLSYFFLLPNVCFPLFPVVDYRTFRRTWYDGPAFAIHQTGVSWIVRGFGHLVLYRLVDYHLTLAPFEVEHLGHLVRHVLGVYLLYLRISGQFHIIVGILRLFGYALPETHHLYFLAPDLNDYWRRINIYWKDFMMKVLYYPMFFRLRRVGPTLALLTATGSVFVATWLLHSYQWFWLRGSFPLVLQDVLFWGLLGLLVMATAWRESRRGRRRRLGSVQWSWRRTLARGATTTAIFAGMAVLWSLWMSESVSGWLDLWKRCLAPSATPLPWLAAILAGGLVYTLVAGSWLRFHDRPAPARPQPGLASAMGPAAAAIALLLLTNPLVASRVGGVGEDVLLSLAEERLGRQDQELLERGYYEELVRVDRFNSRLWELYSDKPPDWKELRETPAIRQTGNLLHGELLPLVDIEFKGARLRTNRWGLRDRPYRRHKPAGTYRFAVLGASHTMGSGVGDHQTFENLLEDRLNAEARNGMPRFEVLNFATAGYGPGQQLYLLEHKVLRFEPDAVVYVAHPSEPDLLTRHLAALLADDTPVPYPEIQRVLADVRAKRESIPDLRVRIAPHRFPLLEWMYGRMAELARNAGAEPVWVLLPRVKGIISAAQTTPLRELAGRTGFEVVPLFGVYRVADPSHLVVASWDDHPNPEAHRLVADRLYDELMSRRSRLGF